MSIEPIKQENTVRIYDKVCIESQGKKYEFTLKDYVEKEDSFEHEQQEDEQEKNKPTGFFAKLKQNYHDFEKFFFCEIFGMSEEEFEDEEEEMPEQKLLTEEELSPKENQRYKYTIQVKEYPLDDNDTPNDNNRPRKTKILMFPNSRR